MALKPTALPDSAALSTAMLAVVAVGYVLAAVGPQVRAARDLQRAWNDARTAVVDAYKKLERAPNTVPVAQRALDDLSNMGPNDAVLKLKKARAEVANCIEAFDLAVLAIDTARSKVLALRKFRAYLIAAKPDFDSVLDTFENDTAGLEEARKGVDALRESNLLEQMDETLALAVESATTYAMARSLVLAKTRPRPTVDDALESLKRVHDFARAHGAKLGA